MLKYKISKQKVYVLTIKMNKQLMLKLNKHNA